jgi:hypothetical protein
MKTRLVIFDCESFLFYVKTGRKTQSKIMHMRRKIVIVTGLAVLITAVIVGSYKMIPDAGDQPEGATNRKSEDSVTAKHATSESNEFSNSSDVTKSSQTAQTKSSDAAKTGPAITKAGQRNSTRNASGRKVTVDPMASWREIPAWPEGPRLFAEVETSGKRYVNLRPNDMGLLPQLNVEPEEPITVTLSLPESSPGDSIYLELPNGGGFPNETAMGKVLKVGKSRSITFDFRADESRGNCTLHIRQAGHTRTLPLWIGEPQALAQDDGDAS